MRIATKSGNAVEVANVAELKKFIEFAGGEFEVYMFSPFNEWITVGEWCQSNELEAAF